MLRLWCCGIFVLLTSMAVTGCGRGATSDAPATADTGTADPSTADPAATGGPKVVDVAKLPPLGNPLPPNLDGGRISELAPPKGWDPLPRDNAHVARFVQNKINPNDLPRILVTATDADIFTADVTPDNVADFVAALEGDLDASKLLETPKPLVIGDNAYARYVGKASKSSRLVARQVLETVHDGRRYAITLETFDARLLDFRDLAYAVANKVKFKPAGGTAAPRPAAEPDTPEPPADAAAPSE